MPIFRGRRNAAPLFTSDGQYYQGKMYRDGKQVGTCQLFENEPPAGLLTRSEDYWCEYHNSDPEWIFCSYIPGDEHPICEEVASEHEAQLLELLCLYYLYGDGDEEEDEIGGPTSDDDSDNNEDTNTTEPGGTTGGNTGCSHTQFNPNCADCRNIGFNHTYPINNVQMDNEFYPDGWCEFYTLAALCGGSPADYERAFYNTYHRGSIKEASKLNEFYRLYLNFHNGGVVCYYSFIVAEMAQYRALLNVSPGHIYVICGLRGWNDNPAGALMDKYDTEDPRTPTDPYSKDIDFVMPNNCASVTPKQN